MSNKVNERKFNKTLAALAIGLGVVFLLLIVFIILDSVSGGKIYIDNETDKNISMVRITFEDYDGNLMDNLSENSLKAHESTSFKYGDPVLYGGDPSKDFYGIAVYVQFEGEEEIKIEDGLISSRFDGNIRLRFYEEDGDLHMYAKAGLGLFESTAATDINTDFILLLDEADYEIADFK